MWELYVDGKLIDTFYTLDEAQEAAMAYCEDYEYEGLQPAIDLVPVEEY